MITIEFIWMVKELKLFLKPLTYHGRVISPWWNKGGKKTNFLTQSRFQKKQLGVTFPHEIKKKKEDILENKTCFTP